MRKLHTDSGGSGVLVPIDISGLNAAFCLCPFLVVPSKSFLWLTSVFFKLTSCYCTIFTWLFKGANLLYLSLAQSVISINQPHKNP